MAWWVIFFDNRIDQMDISFQGDLIDGRMFIITVIIYKIYLFFRASHKD